MQIGAYIQRLESIARRLDENTLAAHIGEVVEEHEDMVLGLNKDTLLLGRDNEGAILRPGYSSDPYLDTPEARKKFGGRAAYIARKKRLESLHIARITHVLGYPNKNPDTPNIRYTSKNNRPGENFQDSMYLNVLNDRYIIGSDYRDADAIEDKYDRKLLGLSPLARDYFWENVLYRDLLNFIFG